MSFPNKTTVTPISYEKSNSVLSESSHSNIGRLAKGAGITLVGRITGRGTILLNQIILARLLSVEAFGLYALGWTILRISSFFVPLGLDKGVIRFGAHSWGSDHSTFRSALRQSLGGVALFGIFVGTVFYLLAPWLANHLFSKPESTEVFHGFAIVICFAAILRVAAEATRITQKMHFSVISEELIPPVVQLILIVVMIYLCGWGLHGAILSVEIAFAIGLMSVLFFIWKLFPEIFTRKGKSVLWVWDLLKFSLPTSLAGIFTMLIIWIDRLFVGYFLQASDVGIYQAASQMTLLLSIILSAFNVTFSPMIVKLYNSGKKEELNDLFKISTKWGFYISLPLFFVFLFAPTEVLIVSFGAPYRDGALYMVILATAQLINAGTGAVGLILTMTGYQNRWLLISVFALISNVVLNILLIPRFYLTGAAIATAFSILLLFIIALFQVKDVLGLWPYDRRYFKGVISALGTILALFLLQIMQPGIPLIQLFWVLVISFGVFTGLLFLLGLDKEDQQFMQLVLNRLSSKHRQAHA